MKDIKVEVQYRQLVTYMIDFIVLLDDPKVLWLIESGFINAKDMAADGWDKGVARLVESDSECGYWEFVYVSIASNIDDHFRGDPRFQNDRPDNRYIINH